MEKEFSEMCRHVISFFLKSEKRHIGSSLTTIPSWGPREEGQGRWGRSMEVGGGDLGGGESEGELAPFVFLFSPATCLFGFSPHNFLIRAKMHKSKKETNGGINDPILTHPE